MIDLVINRVVKFENSNWQFPLGNYSQGDYGNNSVVFNGTVPLIAIISKIFSKIPKIFSILVFGFCLFFLQGFISNLLIFKLTKDKIYSFISSIFF